MKTVNSFLQTIAIVILGVFLIQSCKKSDTPAPQSTTPLITEQGTATGDISIGSIGASGGSLQSADGNLTVTVPSGALSSTTAISIQPISNKAPLSLGSGYRLLPEGTTFTKPIQLTFHYTDQLLKGSLPDFLWIVTQASDGSWNAMLKSVVDKSAKTVTIETTHFSDWALGKFIDFTLDPSSSTIQKGQSVQLKLSGFSRDKALKDDDELAPLVPITGSGDGLTPLTPIPPIESRLMDFKVKQWTMNGAAAPVSNSNGSLSASGNNATYTAPNKKPTVNPVAVSVQLEADNKEGGKASYMVTSSISVVDADLYLLIKVDGQPVEYYEYGFNGAIPPDPNNFTLVNCGLDNGRLMIVASLISNSAPVKNLFEFTFNNPSETTRTLLGSNKEGKDDLTFSSVPGTSYTLNYTQRKLNTGNICDRTYLCGNASVTLLTYTGSNSIVRGYFSGTLYEDKQDYENNCKTPDTHTIEGEFNLMLAN